MRNGRKSLYLFLLFAIALFAETTFAQSLRISGKITDKNGKGIEGASVRLKGKRDGVPANENGEFSISAKPGDVLIISAVNFKDREIKANQGTNVNVVLDNADALMDEVVVTAGGIKTKRKEIGTATSIVRGDALNVAAATNIAGGLQGKVAGLQISNTSGGVNPNFRLILRGQRSLTGNNQALVVLDNIIVPTTVLPNLNPEDVEDVTILNGAGAAALYGSQASNGAVIITTKKGKKGFVQIRAAQTFMAEQVAFWPKLQTEFGSGGDSYGYDNNGNPVFAWMENQSYGPKYDGSKKPLGYPLEDGSQDSAIYSNNNSKKDFWQHGLTSTTDFSLTSGDDVSTIFFSGQWMNAKGTTPGDQYNRGVVRLNGTRKIGKNILLTYATSYAQNRYNTTTATGSIYNNLLNIPSWIPVTSFKDWRNNKFANPNGYYNPWYQNPYFTADDNRQKVRNDYLTANVEVRYTPIEGLDIVGRQSISTRNSSNKTWVVPFTYTNYAIQESGGSKQNILASVADGSFYTTELLTDLFAQYRHRLNKDFDINFIGGLQLKQDQAQYINVSANGLVIPDLYNVSAGVGTPGASEADYITRQAGLYGDARLGYKNYLYLHVTGRNDWVSVLLPQNRSFFYPAADLSFIASDAIEMLKASKTISFLKLRAGVSKVGNVNIGNSTNFGAALLYPTYSQANGYPYGSQAGYTTGSQLVSTNLKPEITKQYEFGFDLNLLKDKIVSSFTYFNSKTNNQTVPTSLSNATGYSTFLTNTGQTSSSGIEATLHVTPVRTKDLEVTVGGNYSYLHNVVNSIGVGLPYLSLAQYGDGAGSYAVAGQPFPVIMGYDYARDPQGHVVVDPVTGWPSKDPNIKVLGNSQAKNRVGLDASVRFKNFRFSALFEYRGGYKIYNAGGSTYDWAGVSVRTTAYDRKPFVYPNSVYLDPSTGQYVKNTNIEIGAADGNSSGFWTDQNANMGVTSNYVTSAAFWKVREIAISYMLPQKMLERTKFIKTVTISVQGRNLFEWLSKDNIYTDPEYSDAGNDSNGIGLTNLNQSPPSRFFGGTISVTF